MPHRPILCVDDEPNNLALIRQILQDDYRLVFARSGTEALQAVAKHDPALILLDVEMPDIDGYTVASTLKDQPETEHIPIIFVTSLDQEVDERTGFASGGVDYIAKPVSPYILRARVSTHLSLVRASALNRSYRDAIQMLGMAGHYNDSDTGTHIWRMAAYARALAEAVGWERERAELLEQAAPMHDTGKIGIPDAVLKKPGKLDEGEWKIMKTHPRIGYEILSKSQAPLFQLAAEVSLYHHERWDGSGYPAGLAGEDIPESARIVAVADVFDALTTKRPYKEPWPVERALETLRTSAGSHLDARMVEAFERILPRILALKQHWDQQESRT
ncbi:response regulator [Pseudoxanthomonas wuyuanensis]|uniref:Putative two-component system response regulator n=1 Tax=Pseudoxanthomonas wuyuanensis TaxID=1073196 RepID=A0A286DDX3_9GAMM|nr:HD domain-containing phosphohydrolase [Pseudoxanthomonas wuyuanensis]KAF1720002.1 two-component system response regulator [Pseudoxanthomonas wuyuanensis]SOD56856.1 putative two-component system response regulator [Pseudoxanthomonas wuyuanensis]